MNFSVLMSVYVREKPHHLEQALDSLLAQTVQPSEVVIVEDGPLTEALHAVIAAFKQRFPTTVSVVLLRNLGLGLALNHGLKQCRFPIIARMDSDDIAMPLRFEKQLAVLQNHEEIDFVGSWIDEFFGSTDNVISVRKVPEKQQDILHFAHYRNPMNHPTVMFRKAVVEAVHGYCDVQFFEDYDLWARALQAGCCFYNMQESLLWFRLTDESFRRRGGISYIKAEIRFQKRLYRSGFINLFTFLKNVMLRLIVRLLPNRMRRFIYVLSIRK